MKLLAALDTEIFDDEGQEQVPPGEMKIARAGIAFKRSMACSRTRFSSSGVMAAPDLP